MAKEASLSDQFDAPWKVAVERFLQPLLHLCFPAVHDAIDWRHRPEFLDTELQALGPDHQQGARTIDKLVKVRRLDGADQRLFLHIEIQAQSTAHFPWRMWVYYYRLYDKYGPGVISLAILADADPRWRPHTYEAEIVGCGLRFEFPVFKVLDCEDAETRFEQTGNPFALVLAAQQLALATQRDPRARYEGRFRLARHMRRRGLDLETLRDLWRVIHVLTRLPRELELQFRTEVAKLTASEDAMAMTELITPYEEIVLEEGLAKGRVEGRVEGLVEGLLRALNARFGTVPEAVRQRVQEVREESRLCEAMRLVITEPTLDRFLAKF